MNLIRARRAKAAAARKPFPIKTSKRLLFPVLLVPRRTRCQKYVAVSFRTTQEESVMAPVTTIPIFAVIVLILISVVQVGELDNQPQ